MKYLGDSFPSGAITLHCLHYKMRTEPVRFTAINQFANYDYIEQVEEILERKQFKRIKNSFLDPIMKFASKGKMMLSGKMMHCLLTRSFITKKYNELWFHFGGQSMRFSIREFHMVIGLKCIEWVPEHADEKNRYDWGEMKEGHSTKDLVDYFLKANKKSYDEKFSLGMLLLIETIFLHRYATTKYPKSNLEKTQDIDVLMKHPLERDTYDLLLASVKKVVPNSLEMQKYDIHRFFNAIHLWIMKSVFKLQLAFSVIDKTVPSTTFCVKNTFAKHPQH